MKYELGYHGKAWEEQSYLNSERVICLRNIVEDPSNI